LIALDTNILACAEQKSDHLGRHEQANVLMQRLTTGEHIIPVQVFAEFMNACRKKQLLTVAAAASKVGFYAAVFETPNTQIGDLQLAAELVDRFNLQFFDAVIVAVARRSGATILLSEDMHDGLEIGGLRIVNPFVVANEALLADYFSSAV
jgi:predicted nucleic acid-binding protein